MKIISNSQIKYLEQKFPDIPNIFPNSIAFPDFRVCIHPVYSNALKCVHIARVGGYGLEKSWGQYHKLFWRRNEAGGKTMNTFNISHFKTMLFLVKRRPNDVRSQESSQCGFFGVEPKQQP